jgi:hypothetical protein
VSLAGAIDAARAAVGRLFDDEAVAVQVRIVDPSDPSAAGLDPDTLELLPANPTVVDGELVDADDLAVYVGPALIASESSRRERRSEGGAEQYPESYRLRVPAEVTLRRGQEVTVTYSRRDHLVDRRFTVEAIPDHGASVTSIAILHVSERGPRL